MTQELIEQIKLIADFMDISVGEWTDKDGTCLAIGLADSEGVVIWNDEITWYRPNSDWNDLMPVVEKLESLGYEVNINGKDCYVLQPNYKGRPVTHCQNWTNKIETVYQAVKSAVKWHNTQNQ